MPGPDDDKITPNLEQPVTEHNQTQTPGKTTDWESAYKGLQVVVAKRDTTITGLESKVLQLTTEIEELKTQLHAAVSERETVGKAKTSFETKSAELEKELAAEKRKTSQQAIILSEFPQLGSLAQYIPHAEDDENFRSNAKKFAEDMERQVGGRVRETLSGATLPQKKSDTMATEAEAEKMYRLMMSLAGKPGKEAEYIDARDKWVLLLESSKR